MKDFPKVPRVHLTGFWPMFTCFYKTQYTAETQYTAGNFRWNRRFPTQVESYQVLHVEIFTDA